VWIVAVGQDLATQPLPEPTAGERFKYMSMVHGSLIPESSSVVRNMVVQSNNCITTVSSVIVGWHGTHGMHTGSSVLLISQLEWTRDSRASAVHEVWAYSVPAMAARFEGRPQDGTRPPCFQPRVVPWCCLRCVRTLPGWTGVFAFPRRSRPRLMARSPPSK
jgi:hypothetical protein